MPSEKHPKAKSVESLRHAESVSYTHLDVYKRQIFLLNNSRK